MLNVRNNYLYLCVCVVRICEWGGGGGGGHVCEDKSGGVIVQGGVNVDER